ncbi:hypothetical protein NT01EI_2413 [Edwardsiella ictaluri 93-146]|uniref:Uncharacterized protein n=1 Tax=Edwardsiella ictaluri (strain 93-146) TaxID=634503 RepID=C5BAA3_EDWI9|nr:hypothetical protein NT01EI_2413 [Edwardsiella ictaluri 93-146]
MPLRHIYWAHTDHVDYRLVCTRITPPTGVNSNATGMANTNFNVFFYYGSKSYTS